MSKPEIGDSVSETIEQIAYKRYAAWCQSVGIPPAPWQSWAKSTAGKTLYAAPETEKSRRQYTRERGRAEIERAISAL